MTTVHNIFTNLREVILYGQVSLIVFLPCNATTDVFVPRTGLASHAWPHPAFSTLKKAGCDLAYKARTSSILQALN